MLQNTYYTAIDYSIPQIYEVVKFMVVPILCKIQTCEFSGIYGTIEKAQGRQCGRETTIHHRSDTERGCFHAREIDGAGT